MFAWCIKHGVQVAVIALLICVLGIAAALRIPVQMIPDLEVRTISVITNWPGATPQDVEKEILIQQEDYLRNVTGLQRMISSASTGSAVVELEFPYAVEVNDALIRVINALSQVPGYPENVDEPRVIATSFSQNSFMYFGIADTSGKRSPEEVLKLRDFVDERVRPRMERVPGVSQVNVSGAPERQIQIRIDLARLAAVGLTLNDVRDRIRDRNRDISAGDIDSGKRLYLVRTVGRMEHPEELASVILARDGDSIVSLGDVADIELGLYEPRRRSYQNGEPTIRLSVSREVGSNVIEIKKAMTVAVEEINRDLLEPMGLQLILTSDDVRYVQASVKNVWTNLAIGALAATLVLYLFLRSTAGTAICVLGIPVCTIAAFIGLLAAERTINVISLAGIAFALGMTLDNAIVVLESIEKERRQGLKAGDAALAGVRKVWTSVLASTMTTVIVFAPVWLIEEEAGQLFSDIAIAITGAILASMLAAIAIIPTASVHIRHLGRRKSGSGLLGKVLGWFETLIQRIVHSWKLAVAGVLGTVGLSLGILFFLTPPAEYLPEGEEAKVFSRLIAPPGYNLKTMDAVGDELHEHFLPYVDADPADYAEGRSEVPAIDWMILNSSGGSVFIIAETVDPGQVDGLIHALSAYYEKFPGMRSFTSRGSIISSNDGGSRSVNLDIAGARLDEIYAVADAAYRRAFEVFDEPQVNSSPSGLVLQQPLVELRPNWERAAELGFSNSSLGYTLSVLTDGAYVDEFILDGERIDVFLYSDEGEVGSLDRLANLPLYAPAGGVITVDSVAPMVEKVDTASIRRLNANRTVTLNIIPPRDVPLEQAVKIVREEVVNHLRDTAVIDNRVSVDVTGAGDQLDSTRQALMGNFLIALVLSYLLLTAVFSHWGFSLIILTTVPIGIAGGIGGLWLLNLGGHLLPLVGGNVIQQPFDMITMLGFLILLGTVVNNPILIVSRTIDGLREGLAVNEAIEDAALSRLRPILMSTTTTVFGIAPLVLFPGAGTELYRGVGAIVLFGLLFSTLVTVIFLPSFLVLLFKVIGQIRSKHA